MAPEPTVGPISSLDSRYGSYPAFAQWTEHEVDDDAWMDALERFQAERAETSEEQLRGVREQMLRAAAIDSGAIEGLYEMDRGVT